WLSPQSEYRPTEYVQAWLSFWFDEQKRLAAAKELQQVRLDFLQKTWSKDKDLKLAGFDSTHPAITQLLESFISQIDKADRVGKLLQLEAELTKKLYKL